MAALAIEHEARKEVNGVRTKLRRLERTAEQHKIRDLSETTGELSAWVDRLDATRNIFLPMIDAEDREIVEPLSCEAVARTVVDNLRPLLGRLKVGFKIFDGLHFPPATYSEWSAVHRNVLLNSASATLDQADPRIEI